MEQDRQVTWAFHRLGGMDQVTLETSEELCRLRELDPKLWAALSCPASGLEFDARTLALLDGDGDGRIRIPEVLEAVEWACRRLAHPADMASRPEALPLSALADTEEGRHLAATAAAVLKNLGKEDQQAVTPDDVAGAAAAANALLLNGDGIFPPHDDLGEKAAFVRTALSVAGGEKDAGGRTGLNAAGVDAFLAALKAEQDWRAAVNAAPHPLGEDTAAAWTLMTELKDKLDDYFLRCRLAAFAPQSSASLNAEELLAVPDEHGLLAPEALAALPLSHIGPDAPLRLDFGLNPAWRSKAAAFFRLIAPLLPDAAVMTEDDWNAVQAAFSPYGAALAARPVPASAASLPAGDPAAALAALTDEEIQALLTGPEAAELKDMMARDLAVPAASGDLAELERLTLYYRHLHRLLMNFVSFHDFYSLRRPAAFQAGTLFIDGRSCRLCLPVADVGKHAGMAALSQLCLLYCECRRRASGTSPAQVRNIVAAMTAGSDVFLREGRNGVYVDDEGQDWDATLVKLVHNPISIKQAVWSPYLRMSQMIAEQIHKFAGDKESKLMASAAQKIGSAAAKPQAPFDISKSVGLFAAVGIALGALGTAVGSIAGMLMALHWWQFPLLFLAAFACISGPSAFLAWLKLRKRTLGPLLEASGWAVNGQLPVNLLLGRALTSEAALPGNATRTGHDPLRETGRTGKAVLAVLIAALLGLGYLGWTGELAPLLKKAVTVEQPAPAAAPPAAQPAEAPAAAPAEAAPAAK
ncbi:ABC transporter permease [uncultured Mailhella sp.]|uniref:ABC transporter permease n=1 Tax=uncultured Mailhella sp. TaxID=1981031 RepID=UPI00261AFE3C|nr:ABC transporter permease [uncultured Mailhella sp.]